MPGASSPAPRGAAPGRDEPSADAPAEGSPASVPRAASVRARLLAWYDATARDLPWRRTGDPYAIWVSEVMLQQTRADTVVPYWERWMERWSTLEALADAGLEEVLKSWEGLGYYRRARMLHRAARVVRDRHAGELPDDPDALRELPGVGEYTAGAVASIAFGRAVPAVDGNVRRVLSRLYDLPDPGAAELRHRAGELVDARRPGDFNQALMELGATVCTPTSPGCADCPVAGDCLARTRGVQEERPAPRRRGPVPERRFAVTVAWRTGPEGRPELRMVRRPEDGMLGGMWAFPAERLEEGASPAPAGPDARSLEPVRHTYSHFRGMYLPVLVRQPADGGPPGGTAERGDEPLPESRWVSPAEADGLPLPVAQRAILNAARRALEDE